MTHLEKKIVQTHKKAKRENSVAFRAERAEFLTSILSYRNPKFSSLTISPL